MRKENDWGLVWRVKVRREGCGHIKGEGGGDWGKKVPVLYFCWLWGKSMTQFLYLECRGDLSVFSGWIDHFGTIYYVVVGCGKKFTDSSCELAPSCRRAMLQRMSNRIEIRFDLFGSLDNLSQKKKKKKKCSQHSGNMCQKGRQGDRAKRDIYIRFLWSHLKKGKEFHFIFFLISKLCELIIYPLLPPPIDQKKPPRKD